MDRILSSIGGVLARYLNQRVHQHGIPARPNPAQLAATLQPGDVLLVEGNRRISAAIKYLTQSTWSHAAPYIGHPADHPLPTHHCFIEADAIEGVRTVGIGEFSALNTRICRPLGLRPAERRQ